MVLADATKENTTLTSLVLDSNPIGQSGGRALLRAIAARAVRPELPQRIFRFEACSLNEKSLGVAGSGMAGGAFDPSEPAGKWLCDLADPYERMVACELVELAWREQGENWRDATLDGKPFALPSDLASAGFASLRDVLPAEGLLQLSYCSTKVGQREREHTPSCLRAPVAAHASYGRGYSMVSC